MADAAGRAATIPGRAADPALQEQHRQQGRVATAPRELPDAPADAVRRHRQAPDAVLRHPAGRLRRRPGRHRPGRRAATASRSPSGPTSSRSRSAWRPRSSGRSSTPATSRTPTPRSTAACTSSSATPTCREISTYLKVGTTALVLAMIEDAVLTARPRRRRPGRELRAVSHDPTLQHLMRLRDGRRLTALELQREYLERARKYRRGPLRQRRRRADQRRARPLGVGAGPARPRPDAAAPASWTGSPSCGCWRATASARTWTGTRPSCSSSTCSTPTSGRTRGSTTGWSRAGRMQRLLTEDEDRARRRRAAGGHPRLLPGPLPGAVRATRSPPPPGTRSSSTSPAGSRCSGCR